MAAVGASNDSAEDRQYGHTARKMRSMVDRSIIGYVMCINCGHNGTLHKGEAQHLALHLRAARFGKYADGTGGEKSLDDVIGGDGHNQNGGATSASSQNV